MNAIWLIVKSKIFPSINFSKPSLNQSIWKNWSAVTATVVSLNQTPISWNNSRKVIAFRYRWQHLRPTPAHWPATRQGRGWWGGSLFELRSFLLILNPFYVPKSRCISLSSIMVKWWRIWLMMPVKCWSSLSCVSRFSRSINLHFIPLNLIRRVLSASSTSAKVNAAISGHLATWWFTSALPPKADI